ncbi:hypothetical protein LOD99_15057 [Oopsacas minuta]|uniref:TTF-type domain-containing protein n=1 Tax=Oopsacas minuta TaxID=111878 RepID=A0AAV7KDN4_9METZ|nr:hypothetical protein LOD99_15057 [Oopsacas minuta]
MIDIHGIVIPHMLEIVSIANCNFMATASEPDSEEPIIRNEGDYLSQPDELERDSLDSFQIDPGNIHSKFDKGHYVAGKKQLYEVLRSEVLLNCWVPPDNYKFPPIIQGGRKRYFNSKWLINNTWLAYSEILSGGFCKICVLFLDRHDKLVGKGGSQMVGSLVTKALTNYKCVIELFNKHSQLIYHRDCCVTCKSCKRMAETPRLDIQDQLDRQRIKQKVLNRQRLVPIIETILFLVRQELSFLGHRGESKELDIEEPKENDDNFRAALGYV